MAEQMRPASKADAPDPSNSYERAHPSREAGMGDLKAPKSTPHEHADSMEQAVKHRQDGTRQTNADDVIDQRRDGTIGGAAPAQPDHSMKDEEPMGWDQAPTDIRNPRDQRHPKTDGKGGTP